MPLRTIAAASALVFLVAIAYVFLSARDPSVAVSARVADSHASAAPAVDSSPGEPGRSATPVAAAARVAQGEWSPQDMPAIVARRWREARDKREFFDRAVEVGGGAHLHFALETLQRCRVVNEYGMVGAEQDMNSRIPANDPARARRLEAYRSFIQGCEGFEMRKVNRQEMESITRRLYEQGDATGKAYNLRPYPDAAAEYDEVRATAVELLETADPYVLQLLVPYLAARKAGNLTWAQFVSSDPAIEAVNREMNAWSLALCELGLDCSSTGNYGNLHCFAIGKCDWKAIDEIAPSLYTGGVATPLPGRREEIVAAVRAHDWSKLGL